MPTRQILFIQGAGAGTHDDWDDKLVDSLRRDLGDAYEVRYPRLPNESEPTYATWSQAILRQVADLDDGSVLVGHSVGGTILIHSLVERPPAPTLAAVILVAAPFVGDGGWPADGFDPKSDIGARLPRDLVVHVVLGLEDETVPRSHADLYATAIPQAHLHLLPGLDHQLGNDLSAVAALIRASDREP